MNETMKKNLKRSLAAFLAVLMVAGLSYFAKDSALKADENAPESEVVEEIADVPAEQVNEPEPEVVVQEVIVTATEPVVEEPAPAEEPAPVEEPAPAEEPAPVDEPVPAEESAPVEEPAPAEEEFDIEEAYEHYMTLSEDWQKEQYLNSLSAEDRAALRQYIADKEAEAAAAAAAQEAILAELAAQAEAETELETVPTEEAPLMLSVAAPETEAEAVEETVTEAAEETAAETEEAPEELAEEPAEEPVDLSFGSAHIGGEWSGRETSSARSLTINIYVDGNLADNCVTSANRSVANFVIYAGDNEITDVTTDYWAMSGSGAAWSVDMYGANDVTVNVNMKSLLPAEEEAPAEEAEETEEAAEETEPTKEPEEAETEPSYAVTEEWAGRATSTDRTVHLVFMLGEEVLEARDITGRNTEVTFSVAAEGYTVLGVESDAALTNDGELYTVDMNSIYEATVTVTLAAPAAEEEEEPAEEAELTEEPEEEVEYLTDEEGNLILDEDGNPIPVEKEETAEAEEAAAEAITYLRDENGNLILDENGDPIFEVAEGEDVPVDFERDENGNLILDENGNPIPTKFVPYGAAKIYTVEDLLEPNSHIDIYASIDDPENFAFGDQMKLTAVVYGYDKLTYTLQWQTSPDDETWEDIEGETGEFMYVTVTEENLSDFFRVSLTVTGAIEEDVILTDLN